MKKDNENISDLVKQKTSKKVNFGKRILFGTACAATYFGLTYTVQSPFSEGEITPTTLYITGGFFLAGLIDPYNRK